MTNGGFTLAEVLITLGIIGVVAAITLPAIIQNYQKMVLKNQFGKFYCQFFNAVRMIQAENDGPIGCYYRKQALCKTICIGDINEYGGCTKAVCEDGNPVPQDNASVTFDCLRLQDELFTKKLKVVKFCKDNALANGCVSDKLRGIDIVPDVEYQYKPSVFSDDVIKNTNAAWVLADGAILVKHSEFQYPSQLYLVDINGAKSPNKWGYDIFTFALYGDEVNGITEIRGLSYITEKGGTQSSNMFTGWFN